MRENSFDGFVRVAAATSEVSVADCERNAENVLALMKKAAADGVSFLCTQELCLTGYTCGDLFLHETLIDAAARALVSLAGESASLPLVAAVGLPLIVNGKLLNVAAILTRGKILGFVPKSSFPNYGEFYELRHFSPPEPGVVTIDFAGAGVPVGTDLIFQCEDEPAFKIAAEICEDMWTPVPPSCRHALAGATVIINLSASDEVVGKAPYRRTLAAAQSGRLVCCYVYAGAGRGESSTDMIFGGHEIICENGVVLSEAPPFGDAWAAADIDLLALEHDRRRMNTWGPPPGIGPGRHETIKFSLDTKRRELRRFIDPHPFVPRDDTERSGRCETILGMQVAGLERRITGAGAKTAVIGISGGLDSCLALLVTARAMRRLGRPASDIVAVTMPCFGTTDRTRSNAHEICRALGVECRDIDISETVTRHLRDIGVSGDSREVVYENAQARVRTLVLMDLANKTGGLVVGTGDLSELALGWATYNGDHMSMYGVNCGVPKTLVRHIVKYAAETSPELKDVLEDILATPVSPELLPPEGGDIAQKTEDIVGPYELHDFFLYHFVRWGRSPARIFALARAAFGDSYGDETILKWLRVFFRRFFAQQFKRSCMPDGPKIGSVSLSPRGDWRMPSDAACSAWTRELDELDGGDSKR
jgi:NAD+ synthase (glutamine-hydrolysing)